MAKGLKNLWWYWCILCGITMTLIIVNGGKIDTGNGIVGVLLKMFGG
jgi:hypothetical protein